MSIRIGGITKVPRCCGTLAFGLVQWISLRGYFGENNGNIKFHKNRN